MIMCIQNLVKFCPFILKIWSKNLILESIKGCNSVANLRKTTIYNTNIDLVNDDVYTKFGLILSIRSQDIVYSKNQILTSIEGRNSVANLRKTKIYNTNLDLVTDNVYTNFGRILSIRSQDIEQKPNSDVNQLKLQSQICNSVANLRKTMIYK